MKELKQKNVEELYIHNRITFQRAFEKYIDTWYNSVKEADKIFILDTGSTDNTFNLLKDKEKVTIKKEIISPWRFDVARNNH